MSSGIAGNLMFHIYKCGVVLHMFTFRRTSKQELALTWRSASLLYIHKVIKVGCSIIPPPRRPSFQNKLNLMNITFLVLKKLHLLQNHLSCFHLLHFSLYWIQRGTATQTMLQQIHYIHNTLLHWKYPLLFYPTVQTVLLCHNSYLTLQQMPQCQITQMCSQMLLQQCKPNLSLNHLFLVIYTHHYQFYHQHQNQTFHLLSDTLDVTLDLQ